MMSSPLIIAKKLSEQISMDYAFLRQEGIKQIERLGSKLWTDYNTHDPGITILEQLCYAITDLGYRINHDLPDILAEDAEEPFESLFRPSQILTSNPVTLLDLRKVIVDIKGVKNAWIETVEKPQPHLFFHKEKKQLRIKSAEEQLEPVFLKGLYQVWVEPDRDNQENLKERVVERLHACRNLCEDFISPIKILSKQAIQIDAKIEIDFVEDAEQVLVAVYEQIERYFSPPLRFYSLSERLNQGKSIDKIFEGPRLEHGFIDSSELQRLERRTELRTSDLIRVIMDVEGVRAVQDFKFVKSRGENRIPTEIEKWLLRLGDSNVPQLDLYNSKIILHKEQLEVAIPKQKAIDHYKNTPATSGLFQVSDENEDCLPAGRSRNIGSYFSIQHHFPDLYGVNSHGLSDTATPQRKAQAKQLKAYLLFFDQLLANYFAQLAHVKDLFSFTESTRQTYFAQILDDVELSLDDKQTNNLGMWTKDRSSRQTRLQQITEDSDFSTGRDQENERNDRKNRFLNHLLARFAEQFSDYSLALYSLENQDPDKLLRDKQAFLQNYPDLSSARGTAFNYLKPIGPGNRSGLEQRIRYKLGIVDPEEDFYVVEHILLRPVAGDKEQQTPLLGDVNRKDPYSLQLSLVFPDWPERFSDMRFRQFVEQTVRDETPVHLTIYIRWLNKAAMQPFELAHKNKAWLAKRQAQWVSKQHTDSE